MDKLESSMFKQLNDISLLKIDKNEFYELLPKQHDIDQNINKLISLQLDPFIQKLEKKLFVWDEKIIVLKKEFDIGRIERIIKQKADLSEFNMANELQ